MLLRKHRFGFNKNPKYSDSFNFKGDWKAFMALALKAAKKLDWEKKHIESTLLIFRSKEKRTSHGCITIDFDNFPEVSIQSETILDQTWDIGKNYKRVIDFKTLVLQTWDTLTEIDKSNIRSTDKELLEFFDYKEPREFKKKIVSTEPNNSFVVRNCGLIIFSLGLLFGYLKHLGFFIGFTREIVLAFSLWTGIYFGAKNGRIYSFKVLKRLAYKSVIAFYSFHFLFIHSLMFLRERKNTNLMEYFTEQYNGFIQDVLPFISEMIIVTCLFGILTGYLFFKNLKLSLSKMRKDEIPREILEYAEFLVAKGESNYQIKKHLKDKGIIDYEIHNQILQTIRPKSGIV